MVEGFELGANDYLKKPFGMQELIVRIKALLGRACPSMSDKPAAHTFEIGHYLFNSQTQTLTHTGLTQQLSYRNRNQVTDMRQLLLDLWGDDTFFNQRSLHVFITKLRHKLSKDKRIRIVNVRGIGYKLIDTVLK